MIDSYNTYISRSVKAQTILKQYENKISYFLQVCIEKNKFIINNKNLFTL
jgi:hypothetical protein